MKEAIKNSVIEGLKKGNLSISTLRMLQSAINPTELKEFVNSQIDTEGNRPLHFATTKEIADLLVKMGADIKDYKEKSSAVAPKSLSEPSKLRTNFDNRDNLDSLDFPETPKTMKQFGTNSKKLTQDSELSAINLTNAQFIVREELISPKTSVSKFKEIMESNPGKFFRDNINADLDGKGNTLLHLVKNDEIREYLIAEHKANARARNNEGKTYSGRTDSKEMEFVPKTERMDTLRFNYDVQTKGSRLDLRQSDIRIGAHRKPETPGYRISSDDEAKTDNPTITNQYGKAPAITDAEAEHAIKTKRVLTQYGQLFSDDQLKDKRASTKLSTLVADEQQPQRPKLERRGRLGKTDIEILRLTSNKITPKIDAETRTVKETKKSMLRDKAIKAQIAAKEKVGKFVDKIKNISKNSSKER